MALPLNVTRNPGEPDDDFLARVNGEIERLRQLSATTEGNIFRTQRQIDACQAATDALKAELHNLKGRRDLERMGGDPPTSAFQQTITEIIIENEDRLRAIINRHTQLAQNRRAFENNLETISRFIQAYVKIRMGLTPAPGSGKATGGGKRPREPTPEEIADALPTDEEDTEYEYDEPEDQFTESVVAWKTAILDGLNFRR